jgi:hypothetical protein
MEAEPLTGPPLIVEEVVQLLIPPAARETVVGDLREIYCSPSQYAVEALRTVPLVILSCAVRSMNLPLLALQGTLIFFCLEGLGDHLLHLNQMQIGLGTAAALMAILLRDTYQQAGRPTVRRSIIEAIMIAFFMVVFCPEAFGLKEAPVGTPDFLLELQLVTVLPLAIPALGILRTLLIIHGDRDLDDFADSASDEALTRHFSSFLRYLRLCYLAEALALLVFAIVIQALLNIGPWLLALYTLVAVFLLNLSRASPGGIDDASALRTEYRRQFHQRQQLRRFLSWLWAAPVLIALYEQLIRTGLSTHRAVLVTMGSVAVISICFLVSAINRECTGRAQEKIGLLEHGR